LEASEGEWGVILRKGSLMGNGLNCLRVMIRVREDYGCATALLFISVLLS